MAYIINNNALEIDPSPRRKRKRSLQCTNAYMNPALDLLSTEDVMCNTQMEVNAKRKRRSRSCDSRVVFENPGLDIGISNKAINGLLRKELTNVNDKLAPISEGNSPCRQRNDDSLIMEDKFLLNIQTEAGVRVNSTPMINNVSFKRRTSFDLSFIEKLGITDSPNGEALYLDDDLNESNIMEIKTIITIPKKSAPEIVTVLKKNTNPFLNDESDFNAIEVMDNTNSTIRCSDFPFDLPVKSQVDDLEGNVTVSSYDATSDVSDLETISIVSQPEIVMPRRLFANDTYDSSMRFNNEHSTVIDMKKFGHSTLNGNNSSPIYQNEPLFVFGKDELNKQSKILGCDVTNMSRSEIFDCDTERRNVNNVPTSNIMQSSKLSAFVDNSKVNKKDVNIHKSTNKISSKIFNKLKDVFKHDKKQTAKTQTANPYEVIRKTEPHEKKKPLEPVCFENPAMNLNSTDTDIQYIDEDDSLDVPSGSRRSFTNRNPLEITPMKRKNDFRPGKENYTSHLPPLHDCVDLSDACYQPENFMKKHVRFDTSLNHEKVITGNSFDSDNSSIGSSNRSIVNNTSQVCQEIDLQIDEYHNELENCFNEQKFITQNL